MKVGITDPKSLIGTVICESGISCRDVLFIKAFIDVNSHDLKYSSEQSQSGSPFSILHISNNGQILALVG